MLGMDNAPTRIIDRMKTRIDIDSHGCWNWTGAKTSGGYGRITWSVNKKMIYALTHRVMWTATNGAIPAGFDIDHLCRNRACCNPEHLEPVTRQTNLLRGDTIPAARASATHCHKGHEFTAENTRTTTLGQRECRTCKREANRAYYWKNRERRAAYNRALRASKKLNG